MRYLGRVYAEIQKEEAYPHLKMLLESEILVRTCKHLFNHYLRESPHSATSDVVVPLLNLLFASEELL